MKHALTILLTCGTALLWAQPAMQTIPPLRMLKVRWENQRVTPLSDWVEMGEVAPVGGCVPGEQVVFDHTDSPRPIIPFYSNRYWVNDIRTLADPRYNGARATGFSHLWYWDPRGGSERCLILLFTVEKVDAECENVHQSPILEAVLLDFGVLTRGLYRTAVCLSLVGGLKLPAIPADDGAPGTVLLGGYGVLYARDLAAGVLTPASGAQPVLAYVGSGDSTAVHWSDDNPHDGTHAPNECYRYVDERGLAYGGAVTFSAVLPCSPDLDGSGCVDDADLLTVLFNFGDAGNPGISGDANCDGTVNDADLLSVLFAFGQGC